MFKTRSTARSHTVECFHTGHRKGVHAARKGQGTTVERLVWP